VALLRAKKIGKKFFENPALNRVQICFLSTIVIFISSLLMLMLMKDASWEVPTQVKGVHDDLVVLSEKIHSNGENCEQNRA
jgi:hypothetical protein